MSNWNAFYKGSKCFEVQYWLMKTKSTSWPSTTMDWCMSKHHNGLVHDQAPRWIGAWPSTTMDWCMTKHHDGLVHDQAPRWIGAWPSTTMDWCIFSLATLTLKTFTDWPFDFYVSVVVGGGYFYSLEFFFLQCIIAFDPCTEYFSNTKFGPGNFFWKLFRPPNKKHVSTCLSR